MKDAKEVKLASAARATSAAPIFYPGMTESGFVDPLRSQAHCSGHTIEGREFVDGGIEANCPVAHALDIAHWLYHDKPVEV